MAKHIDISSKITLEKPTVAFCGKSYEVNNGKNTMLLLQQYMEEDGHGDVDRLSHTLEMLLGKAAAKELDALDLPLDDLKTVYLAVMAAATGADFEETEARFQQSQR